MKFIRIATIFLIAVFIGIQFVPVTMPANSTDLSKDIIVLGLADSSIGQILINSCYDCHSNQVVFPWYSSIAPASWLLVKDMTEGRKELNFSEWADYSKGKSIKNLSNIKSEIENNKMPLKIYTFMHSKSKLTTEQKEALMMWTDQLGDSLMVKE